MAHDPYSRLYWRLSDEFPDVFDEPAVLGTYVQLLVTADAMWPTLPHVPANVDISVLVEAGLVIERGKRYTIKGLEKERRKRQRNARRGAAARWSDDDSDPSRDAAADALADVVARTSAMQTHSDRNANGMPSRAKPSREEPRQAKTRRAARAKTRGKNGLQPLDELLGGQA